MEVYKYHICITIKIPDVLKGVSNKKYVCLVFILLKRSPKMACNWFYSFFMSCLVLEIFWSKDAVGHLGS